MKKIMFDDRFGLTQAVLEGRKTMTRRIVTEKLMERAHDYMNRVHGTGADVYDYLLYYSPYKAFEVVAVSQSYKELLEERGETSVSPLVAKAGYKNKMFVRAELMLHRIRINAVHVECLRCISDEDCLREGIYRKTCCPPGDIDYFYHSEPRSKNEVYPTPRAAFAGLIDKVSGKGTWARNPFVYVYEFELVR